MDDMEKLDLRTSYLWTTKEYQLPIQVEFNFTFKKKGEFIPVWSKNKMQWSGSPGHDALSWYLATNRHDFTFRTGLFRSFPKV